MGPGVTRLGGESGREVEMIASRIWSSMGEAIWGSRWSMDFGTPLPLRLVGGWRKYGMSLAVDKYLFGV
jgi:hypothetical protein